MGVCSTCIERNITHSVVLTQDVTPLGCWTGTWPLIGRSTSSAHWLHLHMPSWHKYEQCVLLEKPQLGYPPAMPCYIPMLQCSIGTGLCYVAVPRPGRVNIWRWAPAGLWLRLDLRGAGAALVTILPRAYCTTVLLQ
jgi:hypothetical protein